LLLALLGCAGAAAAQETPNHGLPNRHLTPGATDPRVTPANIGRTICVRGYTRTVRPVEAYTERLKRMQVRQYGYSNRRLHVYEEDHLVPLELGGHPSSPKNLWPEPRWGKESAQRKDHLENKLHHLVCEHRLSLRKAQRIFSTDWVKGYEHFIGHW